MILSGADIIVETLIEQGATTIFGYPGGQILNVYDSLYKYQNKITHILSAHEQGAVHAADGYARVTGKVGVVISTSGPGATNLVTGIANAYLDSIPLVAICGNVPTSQLGTDSFQEIDITGITLPITKHNYIVTSVDELADTIREAFKMAKSGRPGPVLIDVPKDIQIAMCDFEKNDVVSADKKLACNDVFEIVNCIKASKKPFVYFGGGAISSGAEDEVKILADLVDAPIGCSLMGISGVETNHPRFLGMQGMHGHYASSVAMHNADCIISCGVRFNDRVTGNKEKFATKAKIIHIDVDSSEFSKTVKPYLAVHGDIKLTLQKIIAELEKMTRPEWQKKIADYQKKEKENSDNRDGMTPKNVLTMLNDYLDADTVVATDVGQHQMWTAQYANFSQTRRFVSSGGLGTMGFGPGAAIGAAIGSGKRTVLVTGDGSFGMCLQELATMVKNKLPIVILILNNGVLGMVRQWQTLFYEKHYSNTILERKTDFVALAKAFGADGTNADTLNELKTAFDKAFNTDEPYLINCEINKDEFVLPMLPPGGSMDDIITKVGE